MRLVKIMKRPLIAPDIVAYLKNIYPMKSPCITDTDRQIWVDVGIQTVITHLNNLVEQQKREVR